ncbi:MAG: LysE family translocator [Alphaproteobacteria bacterium]
MFSALKLAGAAYMIWLGEGLLRAGADQARLQRDAGHSDRRTMFRKAFVVTALNPKSIVFFVAFVPQFIDPAGPPLTQFAVLEATFVTMAALNVTLWAVAADRLRVRLRSPRAMKIVNRCGGTVLIAAGLVTAAARRVA